MSSYPGPPLLLMVLLVSLHATYAMAQDDAVPPGAHGDVTEIAAHGHLPDARQAATGLVQLDDNSAVAWIAVAQAKRAAGDVEGALEAARKANAYANKDEERYAAALEMALGNFLAERRLYAQLWLRHAAQVAPTQELQNQAIKYFRVVRSQTPWQFTINSSVVPSSNVNSGSSAEILELFGLPFILSGDAQALSGVEFTVSSTAQYRFTGFGDQPAVLSFGGAIQRVTLSREAKELAPNASGSDYAFDVFEVGFSQVVSDWGKASVLRFNTLVGHNRYGNEALTNYARLGISSQWLVGAQSLVTLAGSIERQHRFDFDTRSAWVSRGNLRRAWQVGTRGDVFGLTIGVRDTSSESIEVDNRAVLLELDYSGRQPVVGPITLSALINAERRFYDDSPYSVDGRQDTRGALSIVLGVPEWNYYGFAPTLSFDFSQTLSNIDIYDSRDIGISIGFESVF